MTENQELFSPEQLLEELTTIRWERHEFLTGRMRVGKINGPAAEMAKWRLTRLDAAISAFRSLAGLDPIGRGIATRGIGAADRSRQAEPDTAVVSLTPVEERQVAVDPEIAAAEERRRKIAAGEIDDF